MVIFSMIFKILNIAYFALIYGRNTLECLNLMKLWDRESKVFAEILNRLREGNHTENDIMKIKERCVHETNCSREAPRLFIQNVMVGGYNETVYQASKGAKYNIKAQDSVIGADPR